MKRIIPTVIIGILIAAGMAARAEVVVLPPQAEPQRVVVDTGPAPAALTKAEALAAYASMIAKIPEPRKSAALLLDMMKLNKIPVFYPAVKVKHYPQTPAKFLPLDERAFGLVQVLQKDAAATAAAPQVKRVDAAKPFTIVTANWGHISAPVDCKEASTFSEKTIMGSKEDDIWNLKQHPYASFIVFGQGIHAKDMVWETPYRVKNTVTGDTLEFRTDLTIDTDDTPQGQHQIQRFPETSGTKPCFNFALFEGGDIAAFSWKAFYERL